MSCLVDCPMAKADHEVCDAGPMVEVEVTGLAFEHGDAVPDLIAEPVGYICMREADPDQIPPPIL